MNTETALQTTRKFKGSCEHGHETTMDIHFPLAVEILDCTENDDDDPEWAVGFRSGENHHVACLMVTPCIVEAELVDAALVKFLETPEGQERAVDFIKHELHLEEVTN